MGRVGGCSTQPFTILLSPPRQILQEGVESSLRQLLIEAFISAGRVDNITMVMGLHPQYLSSFWKTQYLLLRMDGPLPYHKRHYIAIMVRMGVPWGYVWSHHLRGVFAWRQEGSWDPRDAPPPFPICGPRGLEVPLGLVLWCPPRVPQHPPPLQSP